MLAPRFLPVSNVPLAQEVLGRLFADMDIHRERFGLFAELADCFALRVKLTGQRLKFLIVDNPKDAYEMAILIALFERFLNYPGGMAPLEDLVCHVPQQMRTTAALCPPEHRDGYQAALRRVSEILCESQKPEHLSSALSGALAAVESMLKSR